MIGEGRVQDGRYHVGESADAGHEDGPGAVR
jgi:hypothetical protein